jgi:hypothetical protein
MSLLIAIIMLALLTVVVAVITAPLRSSATAYVSESMTHRELEAARESKYREIRDLEIDYRTGKLSLADYRATDAALRSEALEILNRLEREFPQPAARPATGRSGGEPRSPDGSAEPAASAVP